MYKFRNSAGAVLGILLMITVCTVALPFAGSQLSGPTAGAAPAPSTQNVRVVNTLLDPATVAGTVQAQQNGVWNVGIDGANNTVKIDSATPLKVRDVDNPALQPFQSSVFGNFGDGSPYTGAMDFPPVPVGKTLIVDYVSARGMMLLGQKMIRLELWTTCNGNSNLYFFPVSYQGADAVSDIYVSSQHVHLCSSAGTTMSALAVRDIFNGANNASVVLTLSGHYVNVP